MLRNSLDTLLLFSLTCTKKVSDIYVNHNNCPGHMLIS